MQQEIPLKVPHALMFMPVVAFPAVHKAIQMLQIIYKLYTEDYMPQPVYLRLNALILQMNTSCAISKKNNS